jgi:hypothetical protein
MTAGLAGAAAVGRVDFAGDMAKVLVGLDHGWAAQRRGYRGYRLRMEESGIYGGGRQCIYR